MRTCEIEGCAAPHRARGLCATHYNQQHQPDRHKLVTIECAWCGKRREKQDQGRRYAERFCSMECRDAMCSVRTGADRCEVTKWHPAHPDYRPPLPVRYIAPASEPRQRAPRVFVGGTCVGCGDPFIAEDYTNTACFCSLRCARRVSKQRYRARKKAAYVANVSPARIFARDGWQCRILDCRMRSRKVDRTKVVPHPCAPVLDHIVPLARGGTHEPANVQCAHHLCNSLKSDRIDDVQLMLFAS